MEENCPGPLPQAKRKDKDLHNDNKISKLIMGKIRPKTSTDMSGGKLFFVCIVNEFLSIALQFLFLDKRQRQDPEDLDPMDYPIGKCIEIVYFS